MSQVVTPTTIQGTFYLNDPPFNFSCPENEWCLWLSTGNVYVEGTRAEYNTAKSNGQVKELISYVGNNFLHHSLSTSYYNSIYINFSSESIDVSTLSLEGEPDGNYTWDTMYFNGSFYSNYYRTLEINTPQPVSSYFYNWLTQNSELRPETPTSGVYLYKNGSWTKLEAYKMVSGTWKALQ